MDNVVVIGYGTTTKKELTGSVSSLKSDDFKQGNITNPLQLLQGQVAGLNIVRADGGDPNGDFEIQLRGMTTMAGGASPLVDVYKRQGIAYQISVNTPGAHQEFFFVVEEFVGRDRGVGILFQVGAGTQCCT